MATFIGWHVYRKLHQARRVPLLDDPDVTVAPAFPESVRLYWSTDVDGQRASFAVALTRAEADQLRRRLNRLYEPGGGFSSRVAPSSEASSEGLTGCNTP